MGDAPAQVAGGPSVRLAGRRWAGRVASPRTGVAPALRSGRILPTGDARRAALPMGGQGTNQDAPALAWRRIAVSRARPVPPCSTATTSKGTAPAPSRPVPRADQVGPVETPPNPGQKGRTGMEVLGPSLARITGAVEFGGGRDAAMLGSSHPKAPPCATTSAPDCATAAWRRPPARRRRAARTSKLGPLPGAPRRRLDAADAGERAPDRGALPGWVAARHVSPDAEGGALRDLDGDRPASSGRAGPCWCG